MKPREKNCSGCLALNQTGIIALWVLNGHTIGCPLYSAPVANVIWNVKTNILRLKEGEGG